MRLKDFKMFRRKNKIKLDRSISFPFSAGIQEVRKNPFVGETRISVNTLKYRSDEFTKEHNGLHILFSGCSNTYGDGLYDNEMWAKILYNKISANTQTSGFFNLGSPGQGIVVIILNIFKYIYNFGKPDVLFINFPVSRRFITYNKANDRFIEINYNKPTKDTYELWQSIPLFEYHYIFMLEQFCKHSGIKLFYGTWDQDNHFGMYDNLEYFININDEKMISDYIINNKDDKFATNARDGLHFGTAFNNTWAQVLYNRYMEQTK